MLIPILIVVSHVIRQGTRLYQSIAVLSSGKVRCPLPHDHLDDLESFFYIFVHIFFVCDAQGQSYPLPEMLSEWDEQNAGVAAGLKEALLARRFLPPEVEERWPTPCLDLFNDLRAYMSSLARRKQELNYSKPEARADKAKELADNVDQHYSHVLQLFDRAIDILNQAETKTHGATGLDQAPAIRPTSTSSPPPALHSAPATPPVAQFAATPEAHTPEPHRSPLKRASDNYPDEEPAAKRPDTPQTPLAARRKARLPSLARSPR